MRTSHRDVLTADIASTARLIAKKNRLAPVFVATI